MRLFLALWPDASVRAALAARRDAIACCTGARHTQVGKLHLTVHFIGPVPAQQVTQVTQRLAVPAMQFELLLDDAAFWPGGLAVLLPHEVPQPLRDLHAGLAAALHRLGLPVEGRAFRPHVTLARDCTPPADTEDEIPASARPEPLHWPVGAYALVESTSQGRYRVLRRYPCRRTRL